MAHRSTLMQLHLMSGASIKQKPLALSSLHTSVQVDRVVTSNLLRTKQTADLVLEQIKPNKAPRLESFEALQEIRKGDYEKLEGDDLHQAFLSIFRGRPSSDTRFQGGESIAEVYQRVLPIVGRELSDPNWQSALWVLHGGINRALLSWWLCAGEGWLGNLLQQPACINLIDAAQSPQNSIVRDCQPVAWRLDSIEGTLLND